MCDNGYQDLRPGLDFCWRQTRFLVGLHGWTVVNCKLRGSTLDPVCMGCRPPRSKLVHVQGRMWVFEGGCGCHMWVWVSFSRWV